MKSLGINIGSSSIKLVVIDDKKVIYSKVTDHEGNFLNVLLSSLEDNSAIPTGVKALVTGHEGRHLLNINSVLESICIERAVKELGYKVDAVASLGGEIFTVYKIDSEGKIVTSFTGNKCASGTGEFFKQQLGRMNMTLSDIEHIPSDCKVYKMSSRCSVFMKSDCTHKLNKGEATKGDIVLSLSDVMATKVVEFLKKAKISEGKVLLSGGLTKNPYIVRFVKEKLPLVEFIIPLEAAYLEAYGSALLAGDLGSVLPAKAALFKPHEISFSRYKSLKTAESRVHYINPRRGKVKEGREYILGVDGGSTTTKVALIDAETDEIVASYYGRTHGDPVAALKKCLTEVRKEIGDVKIKISLVSTTGSSREILGVFLETPAVYNEIIAHAVGTTYFKPDIDTIFEIGGQDAKYVSLRNSVPIDYAMNEACSAGTGSFLEESAAGDLNITDVREIGNIAVNADRPLKFGEHCSAFINSDIRKAIQHGASKEDITAGIITSIVSNYLNRVVGNRSIGNNIVLQGGVAKNKAVPLAFAMMLNKDVTIPPDPELLGCFGVGLLAKQKAADGFIEKSDYSIEKILDTMIVYEREFKCQSCENYCPIRVLNVNGNKYMFGGRCNKYANSRKKKIIDESKVFNYIEKREEMIFNEFAPQKSNFVKKRDFKIGLPMAFSMYTLYPFYSWFFHSLGIETVVSKEIDEEGTMRIESAYCFPAEIAHGAVHSLVKQNEVDYVFVPHFRDMVSYEKNVHATFCPITQSLPYYISKAFSEIPAERFLTPIVSFKFGKKKALKEFIKLGEKLKISEREVREAFDTAYNKQQNFFEAYSKAGQAALDEARKSEKIVIALLGRPYNAFTNDANMGIPQKFTTRGYSVIPFDMLPIHDSEIFENMYWYYGQQDMKSAMMLKKEPNIFLTFITNFSCAPDSFMLHYVKWIMGSKPFLVLELDSHSADAGVDTRVEAFLDIIEGYKSKFKEESKERFDNGYRFVNNGKDKLHILDTKTNKRVEIFRNKNVKMLLSSMGQLSVELVAASLRGAGVNTDALPVPDTFTLQMAKNYMSGKECLPSQLVLGSALRYFASAKYRKDELYLLFVPSTVGPCRTGQYYVFYENLFKDLELENVVVITMDSENSYNEFGPDFTRNIWRSMIIADYMKDIETTLRTCAKDPVAAMARYDDLWHRLISVTEKGKPSRIFSVLKEIVKEIKKIPLKRQMKDTPKVLVVGEIFVRRDDFSVDELLQLFSKNGIIAKVSSVSEWIYYCDNIRLHDIKKRFKLLPYMSRVFSPVTNEYIRWHLENRYKKWVEHKVLNILRETNLVPKSPHDMNEMMRNAEKYFVNSDLYSEITISSGAASTAMLQDYSGVVNIAPFACLIGRVIEGLITPWSRERNFPVISVEIDGDILPPNIINKLEIFMLNVLRFRNNPNISDLVENDKSGNETVTRRKVLDN